jgi:DNA (cytosine-5)-methyltransferase 1
MNRVVSPDDPAPTVLADGRGQSAIVIKTKDGGEVHSTGSDEPVCRWKSEHPDFERVASPNAPAPTVQTNGRSMAAIIVKQGAGEQRHLTIAELRRICGFPDDFILKGTYGQQWERLGRAVPPPMMRAIAEGLRDHIFDQKETLCEQQQPTT